MSIQSPTIHALDQTKWPIVEITVFKCCMDDGTYLGNPIIHDPTLPGDGPWFLTVKQRGVATSFGYGTKQEALSALDHLTRYVERRYEIDIDPWD